MVKERRGFFDDWFNGFGDVEDIFNSLFSPGEIEEGQEGPRIYGFSIKVGTGSSPEIRTFGNIPPPEFEELESDVIEPFTDVIVNEKKGEVIVTAELPGCSAEDVKVDANENGVEVSAKCGDREYHKKVPLKVEIDPKSARVTCNNGICDIKLRLDKANNSKTRKI